MKMILSLTLIWALSSTAAALDCVKLTTTATGTTTTTETCSGSQTHCVTATVLVTQPGTTQQITQLFRGCAEAALCPTTDIQTFSVDLGVTVGGVLASAQCCNTDNCNTNTLPTPAVQSDNSLQCNTFTATGSTTTLQCQGVETQCFQATLSSGPALGCASTNMCAAVTILGTLPFMEQVGTVTNADCCGTSLCNTGTAPTPTTTTTTTADDNNCCSNNCCSNNCCSNNCCSNNCCSNNCCSNNCCSNNCCSNNCCSNNCCSNNCCSNNCCSNNCCSNNCCSNNCCSNNCCSNNNG